MSDTPTNSKFFAIPDEWAARIVNYGQAGIYIYLGATAIAAVAVYALPVVFGVVYQWREPIIQLALIVIATVAHVRLLHELADCSMKERLPTFSRSKFLLILLKTLSLTMIQIACTLVALVYMINSGIKLIAGSNITSPQLGQAIGWFLTSLEIITLQLSAIFIIILYLFILVNSMMERMLAQSQIQTKFTVFTGNATTQIGKIVEILVKLLPDEKIELNLLPEPLPVLPEPTPHPQPEPPKSKRKGKGK